MFVDCQKKYVVSWVTSLVHYDARQFVTLLNDLMDVNSWVRILQESHEH